MGRDCLTGVDTSFWGDEKVLKLTMALAAQLCEHTKKHWIGQLKWLDAEFGLNTAKK